MPGTFEDLEKALEAVKTKSASLKEAEAKMNAARGEYDNAVMKATEIRSKIDEMLNTVIPSTQGRIRVAS